MEPANDAGAPRQTSSAAQSYVAWKEWSTAEFGRYSQLEAAYFRAEVDFHGNGRPIQVLELGYGNGSFLGWARDHGAQAYGIETNPFLLERARDSFGADRFYSDLSAPAIQARKGTFTHVVAFDVLEHIDQRDYAALFAGFAELLCAGGWCVFRYPNGDSPFGRRIQHGDHTHRTTIGRDKLKFFARGAGLEVVAIRAPALPIFGVGVRRGIRRALVLLTRFGIEAVLGYAYFGSRMALDQNATAVLRRV